MKIIHAVTSLDKGGAENHVILLSSEQKKKNNEIFIFVSKNSFYWLNFLKKSKIEVFKPSFFKENNLFFKIYKFFKDIIFLTNLIEKKKTRRVTCTFALYGIGILFFIKIFCL
tara:strand:+ start:870 stop:1208 length:339 start_codon:yes stop_codon:yes gene_type:complete